MQALKSIIVFCILVLFLCPGTLNAQSIYNESLRDIDSNSVSLGSYSNGKKILFIVLPLQTNDSLLIKVKSFADSANGVKVIGILSVEDGYSPAMKDSVKSYYNGSNILLTEALHTRKDSSQSAIMNWLTDRTKNMHFDKGVTGSGFKFFINGQGQLVAVLDERVPLSSPVIGRLINQ